MKPGTRLRSRTTGREFAVLKPKRKGKRYNPNGVQMVRIESGQIEEYVRADLLDSFYEVIKETP